MVLKSHEPPTKVEEGEKLSVPKVDLKEEQSDLV
jgi:hypothetical protein